ncbi:MAG: hypothetical protein DHS20C14_19050 [Phycisphaeraceae bacterium]|nr:MAG: hypothetical protein DHS20C14_19050 [Phycisphaeraceae bacterium]
MNPSGTGAAFRERSNLACLVTTALIYPAIIAIALAAPTPVSLVGLLIAGVAAQVVALIALHIVWAITTRDEPDDERVRTIGHRADRLAGVVLGVGVFLVVMLTIAQGFRPADDPTLFASPIFTGYVLFACFVASELVRMSLTAIAYRTA